MAELADAPVSNTGVLIGRVGSNPTCGIGLHLFNQGALSMSYPLYGGAPPHENVPTSQEAAEQIEPRTESLRQRILKVIADSGRFGTTDDELEKVTGLRHQTVSARRRELYLLGEITYLRDFNGEKVRRKTRSGRNAYVFVYNH